ncbi:MAG: hypothetical protein ACJAYO_001643 [Thalassolituus oleivorans]|jgi:hypothetical protein
MLQSSASCYDNVCSQTAQLYVSSQNVSTKIHTIV